MSLDPDFVSRAFTHENIEAHGQWYAHAHRICAEIAAMHSATIEQVAGVMAALSPRMRWSKNVVLTYRACALLVQGDTLDSLPCLTRSKDQAEAAWQGQPLTGPKVAPFYANIIGDLTAVTVDSHMYAMFGIIKDNKGNREYVTSEVRKMAARYSVRPAEAQAILWTQQRKEGK